MPAYKRAVMPAAINAGFNLNLAYSMTDILRILARVLVSSLSGEANAPNVPLAKTAPITIGREIPAACAIEIPIGISIPQVPQADCRPDALVHE